MKCQLAKYIKNPRHPESVGWCVWVASCEPYMTVSDDYETGWQYASTLVFDTPYFDPKDSVPMAVTAAFIELLHYFADIKPRSWEDWIASGGERLPEEVAA